MGQGSELWEEGRVTEEIAQTRPDQPRYRFAIAADGSVSGGEESSEQLGASLRYACRMASQLDEVLGVGRLEWLTTLSSTSVTARVGQSHEGLITVTAEVERRSSPIALGPEAKKNVSAQKALNTSLKLLHDDLIADWCAAITEDQRLLGARLPTRGNTFDNAESVLTKVGIRALAVVGALHESYRETAVVLDYRQGSLLIVEIDGLVLFAFADKFESVEVARVIARVRAKLVGQDLSLVWTFGTW